MIKANGKKQGVAGSPQRTGGQRGRNKEKPKGGSPGDKAKRAAGSRAAQKAARFFLENERAICDYAQQAGLVFELGDRWTIDMKTGRGTFDPNFFVKRGFSESESMWATCHEIEHFRDWRKDPEAYADLYARTKKERRLDLLYHYINDILANREEDRRFPAHWETRKYLYEDKLFPRINYTKSPRHLQLIYAILREKMLPAEEVALSPEVRAAVERLKNIDGQGTDLILLVSDPAAAPGDRFDVIRDYIEPVYERFFREDVEERKRQEKERRDGTDDADAIAGESMEGGSRSSESGYIEKNVVREEDYFVHEYDESKEKLPQALSLEEAREEIEREVRRRREENKSPEQIAKEQFRSRHGVSAEEVEDYADEYRKIEYQIKPLRGIFERIIATRKEIRRRLKERTDQGVIFDPAMIAQSYIDISGGILNSRTQLKVRREEFDEHRLKEVEFTLVCDLSGSMNENRPGGKSYEQKLTAILITEALDEFEKKLKEERFERAVDLHVLTEIRGFHAGDEELKPLSDTIDFATRVRIARRLEDCTGSRTSDYKSLAKVAAEIDKEAKQKIEGGDLRKVLILITDGGSDDVSLAKEAKDRLLRNGVIAKAIQIGQPGKTDVEKFRYVWQKDGSPCKDVSYLVPTIKRLLEDFLNDL
ncbi:MAG TPA: vWA domain-containing protein [Syntrophorhabdaceae bacterium]|nr:vWA domain-containing protein [Syntrophorhabdaceae bacterium]HQM82347.1 vWA domain-containing protein [Syntrophorhabdaceae bacterium]